MYKYRVVLEIESDTKFHHPPSSWNWDEIVNDYEGEEEKAELEYHTPVKFISCEEIPNGS